MAALESTGYLADDGPGHGRLPRAAACTGRCLLEGEPGTGKTALAEALAQVTGCRADPAAVLRGHRRQPGPLRLGLPAPGAAPARARGDRRRAASSTPTQARASLVRRALPARPAGPAGAARPAGVLLVDEIDRADDEFEAFLLEVLSTYAVTHPRARHGHAADAAARGAHLQPDPRGARRAQAPLPLPLGRPPRPRARGRDRARPAAGASASGSPSRWSAPVQRLRDADLLKPPGVAETLDWARALHRARARASSTSRSPPPRSAPC